jgi:hypothetical protein
MLVERLLNINQDGLFELRDKLLTILVTRVGGQHPR